MKNMNNRSILMDIVTATHTIAIKFYSQHIILMMKKKPVNKNLSVNLKMREFFRIKAKKEEVTSEI